MKIINLIQRSPEWHAWRKSGIGASESSGVIAMSSWKTPMTVWEDKTGRAFPVVVNADMQRGIDLEESARHAFQAIKGHMYIPCCAENSDYPLVKASFDGLRCDEKQFVEIKCPNPRSTKLWDVIDKAIDGQDISCIKELYPDYWVQVQHQYAVCETAEKGYLAAYQNNDIKYIHIPRDKEFINDVLIPSIVDFWEAHVIEDKEPPLSDKDYDFCGEEESIGYANELIGVNEDIKILKKRKEEIESNLKEEHPGNVIISNVMRMTKYEMTKTNYSQACKDAKLDLLPYKKTTSGYFRFTPIK